MAITNAANQFVSFPYANKSAFDLEGDVLVRAGSGYVATLCVTTSGDGVSICDAATVAEASTGNLIASVTAQGVYTLNFPYHNGLVIQTGAGTVVSVSYI